MWIGLVIVLAAAVGGGVYLLSLRSLDATNANPSPARGRGFSPAPGPAAPSPAAGVAQTPGRVVFPTSPGTVYVPLAMDEPPTIGTRFARLLGLIALVCVAGLILAISIWQAVAVVGDLLRRYLGSG